jgi:pimeloyl-ACP methyl ester carboxylesterase
MPDLKVLDIIIHYEEAGQGPTLVLLHGIGSNSRSWRYQLAGLSDEFRVIAWDAPGYGRSTNPIREDESAFRMADFADYLAAFLNELGLEKAHILGLSMGGVIAQEFYRRYPSRVQSLILADSTRGGGTKPEAERLAQLQNRLKATENPAELAKRRAPALLSPNATPEQIAEVESIMSEIHPAGYRMASYAMSYADHTDLLPQIAVPTLVICGEQDTVTSPAESELMARSIPEARLVLIPNAGHVSNQEQPELFNLTVKEFLHSF